MTVFRGAVYSGISILALQRVLASPSSGQVWRWKLQVPLKYHCVSIKLKGTTSQKTATLKTYPISDLLRSSYPEISSGYSCSQCIKISMVTYPSKMILIPHSLNSASTKKAGGGGVEIFPNHYSQRSKANVNHWPYCVHSPHIAVLKKYRFLHWTGTINTALS